MELVILGFVWWLLFVSVDDIKKRIDRRHRQAQKRMQHIEDKLDDLRVSQIRSSKARPKPAYAALHRRHARRINR